MEPERDDDEEPNELIARLKELYYDKRDSGSYGGVNRLFTRAKELGINVSRKEVQSFLTNQQAYSLHKTARRHFVRNKTYVSGIDKQWQADLADMQSISTYNNGYRYILTCIDVFSKFAWAIPIKDKGAKSMLAAFKSLFAKSAPRKPEKLQTDKGTEFFNKDVQAFLQQNEVHLFCSSSDQKASTVERFNRTLKTRIWTYFTAKRTRRYTDALQDIVQAYNDSIHRSIGMKPSDVRIEHETKIWRKLYGDGGSSGKIDRNEIANTQKVRVSKLKGEFEKGYMPNWSEEHFLVNDKSQFPKKVYKLTDINGEEIEGSWYKEELQPIQKNIYLIEKILRRRKNADNTKGLFVKWKGWPEKFNSWITDKDIER